MSNPTFLISFFVFLTAFSAGCDRQDLELTIRGALAIPPTPPQTITYNSISTDPNRTPWVTWGAAIDQSRLGLDSYEISIGSTRCGTEVINWFSFPLTELEFSFTPPTPFVSGTTYYVNVRALDNYNQTSEPTCGDGFLYSGSGRKQQSYIKAPNANVGDFFGASVDIDGDTMVVGAPNESSNQATITNGSGGSSNNSTPAAGAVYVFRKVAGLWQQEAYIKPPHPDFFDTFGTLVSISGDTIAVASPADGSSQTTITNGTTASPDNSALGAGAVFIYKRSGVTWAQEAYIKASNASDSDLFGSAIAIQGDTLAVGVPYDSSNALGVTNGTSSSTDNSVAESGAVFVYKRSGVTWAQEAYIKAPNADALDHFGCSVALDVDTLAVGSCGESSQQTTITNGATASGDNSLSNAGAVYVYKRSGVNWAQEAYIKATNARAQDQFGSNLDLKGDTLAISSVNQASSDNTIINGTSASNDVSAAGAGAVYVYQRTGVNWAQQAFIKASNAGAGDEFGFGLSLTTNQLVISSPNEDSSAYTVENGVAVANNKSANSGAIYLYSRTGATWSETAYIKAANSTTGLNYGTSVAIDGTTVVSGAAYEDGSTTAILNGQEAEINFGTDNSGAVYVYGE